MRDRLRALPGTSLSVPREAEVSLNGKILLVDSHPVAVNEDGFAVEYNLRIVLSVVLKRTGDGAVLWADRGIEDEVRFYAASDPLLFKDNREEALVRLSRRMTERVLDQLLLGFPMAQPLQHSSPTEAKSLGANVPQE
jgi:hypothetical protein